MDLAAFQASLAQDAPPGQLGLALAALWYAGKGHWQQAHELAQQREGDPACAWVHAYLHRLEGDQDNAGYWYRRAGRAPATTSLDQEWAAIAEALLSSPDAPRVR